MAPTMISTSSPPATQSSGSLDSPRPRTRLLVVDDHPAVRAGLRNLLADEADFEVVAAVAAGRRHLPPLPPRLAESLRRRLDHEEQAIFGMLLAGLGLAEIARTLNLTGAELESRLGSLMRRLEALPGPSR